MSDWKISTMSCSAGGAWDVWWRGRGGPWRSQPAGAAAGRAAHAQMIGYALYSKSCTAPSAQKPPAAPPPPAVAAGQRPRSRRAARCPAEWRRSAPSPALVAPRRGGHPGRQGWVGAPWRLYWDSVAKWQGAHVQPPSRQILEKVKFLHAFWKTAVKSGTNIEAKLARTTRTNRTRTARINAITNDGILPAPSKAGGGFVVHAADPAASRGSGAQTRRVKYLNKPSEGRASPHRGSVLASSAAKNE